MREEFNGYLHVIRTAKRPRGGIFEQLIKTIAQNEGLLKVEEYPPTYHFHVPGRTVGVERQKADDDRKWRLDNLFMFRFKGQPKALNRNMEGFAITVRGSYERWENGIGGHMKHYQVASVNPSDTECPCRRYKDE